jgi:two-component system, NarL family, response regulator YdfI
VRVLIAADSAVTRAGLESVITQNPPLSVAGSVSTGNLIEQIRELQPDVVLLAWRRGLEESLDSWIESGPAFVLLTEDADQPSARAGFHSGLRAIIPLQASAREIAVAIEAAAEGLIVLHPDAVNARQAAGPGTRSAEAPDAPDALLTPREIEVLRLLAEGFANKNIAWKLKISEHTVKFHIASIFTKLNVSSRAEAVAIGIRQGVILL